MAMNEIALFKGVRIQPYQKYIDFMFASVLAFIFLVYRIYILFIDYKSVNKKLDILTLFAYFKSSPDSCVKCYTMFLPFLLIKIDVFS
ncbi:putative coupling protein [Staphylococcus aureus]|nr:putative coupling protein [Staphylococcus aureus]CAC8454898.1 putative coupling protein [Staphylococcus aureus]CAC8464510.1 putative coupling protein [Staphylococcus aureus]CAC8472905.1 putative coupling protein [Staphylococcus aureus]CAC8481009.1 putative coupling protein [Staphylococcus aureus]